MNTRHLVAGLAKALGAFMFSLALSGTAAAGPLSGYTISGVHTQGSWSGISSAPQAIPTGYGFGFFGIGILTMSIDDNGQIYVTPDGGSCGSGCSWNFGGPEVFEFTL